MTFSVAVAGASGYGGGELLRLLATHSEFEVRTVTAHSQAGERLRTVHPHLASYGDLTLEQTTAEALAGHDVVFLALPHGKSGALTAQLPADTLVVDAAADHRLEREQDWTDYYPGDWAGSWTYGMPELVLQEGGKQRQNLVEARRIAVPGCNVTAVTLALAPAIRAGLIAADEISTVLAVGPSGAGKKASVGMLASELLGNAVPYNAYGGHRHNPEIRQNLRNASGHDTRLSFTPVLVPMPRGILATCTASLSEGVDLAQVREVYAEAYGDEPFIELLEDGRYPRTADVTGSNRTQIAFGIDERAGRLIVLSALDNLGKGTAGAAVQSANIALGLEESHSLPINGVAP
ncbi:MAG: N-acetyl-gamma-glutamyl-phosphate reductase [Gulosibacter sp.]|uniref:N-acetyl-gamma-glutamyl-phosphate reductase n=1 Tax=Gulosibacter sp. TaxID=2817531 RepID=UPI003F928578